MSRFTEVHVAHVLETTSETWWGDWRCICGQEGRVAHALDLSRTLKGLEIRRAHAAHVESMLVEAGVVAVELNPLPTRRTGMTDHQADIIAKILYDTTGFTDSWEEAREDMKEIHRENVRALEAAGADFSDIFGDHLDRELNQLLNSTEDPS